MENEDGETFLDSRWKEMDQNLMLNETDGRIKGEVVVWEKRWTTIV
jgi:hypothetical protein